MKKANFMKFGKQFLAAVFSIVLLGGIMLNTQNVDAQLTKSTIVKEVLNDNGCGGGQRTCCANTNLNHA